MEDRLKIQYARIPEPSKERGNPAFWKMPAQLKHPCLPPLFTFLTKEELFEVPIIDFAGVPTCILKEKGLISSSEDLYSDEEILNYRKGYEVYIMSVGLSFKTRLCRFRAFFLSEFHVVYNSRFPIFNKTQG